MAWDNLVAQTVALRGTRPAMLEDATGRGSDPEPNRLQETRAVPHRKFWPPQCPITLVRTPLAITAWFGGASAALAEPLDRVFAFYFGTLAPLHRIRPTSAFLAPWTYLEVRGCCGLSGTVFQRLAR